MENFFIGELFFGPIADTLIFSKSSMGNPMENFPSGKETFCRPGGRRRLLSGPDVFTPIQCRLRFFSKSQRVSPMETFSTLQSLGHQYMALHGGFSSHAKTYLPRVSSGRSSLFAYTAAGKVSLLPRCFHQRCDFPPRGPGEIQCIQVAREQQEASSPESVSGESEMSFSKNKVSGLARSTGACFLATL